MTSILADTSLNGAGSSPSPMTDILDIDGLLSFPHLKLLGLLLIILLVFSIIFVLFLFIRRILKSRNRGEETLLAHEKAFLEMERLDKQGLIERGEFRKYSFFASEIYRRYIEEQFHYPALEKTTPEFVFDLSRQSFLSPPFDKEAKTILMEADSIKFAGVIPTMEELKGAKNRILNFIQRTIPAEWEKKGANRPSSLKQAS